MYGGSERRKPRLFQMEGEGNHYEQSPSPQSWQRPAMSKLELQEKTLVASGISFHESQEVLQLKPSLYQRLGEKGLMELSTLFYDRVFDDQESMWFLHIFASSSKAEAIDNQVGSNDRLLSCPWDGPAYG